MNEIGMALPKGPYGLHKLYVLVTHGVRPGWEKRIAIISVGFYTLTAVEADYTYGSTPR